MNYIAALFFLSSLLLGDGWELVKESDGIAVYTRSVEGSDFLAFKGETIVDGSVDALVALLYDTPNAPSWLHDCRFGMTLEEVRFEENYIFETYDLPFPVRNRQVILHATLSLNERGARLDIREANGFCDERRDGRCLRANASGFTRIERSRGYYLFIPQGEKRTKVIWQQHIEPGGNIPGWLANALVVDIPYDSLSKLRVLVREERYRSMTIEKLKGMWQEQYRAFR